ncbi:calcium-binding protein [Roseibacterium sp. SDUM158017]|uniref:calcium-binding protein n=1 Tax=Roseicyclus salinarum TaxID=3036773 RepID=UPI002414D1E6|nr:calcium-binding protein [Roseibacterium sp. SDUM158017]MDG4647055.1 calcium-binding protein [Roseibacterium sp. SDUM158017]
MPGITFLGQFQSGHGTLDLGITSITVRPTASGAMLYTSSGAFGGMAAYQLAAGPATLADHAYFEAGWTAAGLWEPVQSGMGGAFLAVAGSGTAGLWGYALAADGTLGEATRLSDLPQDMGAIRDLAAHDGGWTYIVDAATGSVGAYGLTLTDLQPLFTVADTAATYAADVFRVEAVATAGGNYVLMASEGESGVTAFRAEAGGLVATGSMGANEGLGVMIPTAMEVVEIAGRHFALVASAPDTGSSGALSVLELTQGGALIPTDHVTDTLATRFGRIQAIEVIAAAGRTHVLAGGGDDGLSLFVLLPNGRLHLLEVIAHDGQNGLANVTALAGWADGDVLQIYAASETTGGVAMFKLALNGAGMTVTAPHPGGVTQGGPSGDVIVGGAGHDLLRGLGGGDIIEDGAGADTLEGGAGADRFILRGDGEMDVITDFEPGADVLDLSDWAFLYDAAQLGIAPSASGATVTWRDEILLVQRTGGGPLSEAEILAAVLDAPQRQPFLELLGPSGLVLDGTAGADVLEGGTQDDTLNGNAGNDILRGLAGADRLWGGDGEDRLEGGTGPDSLEGGAGTDALFGEDDADVLRGGDGDDGLDGGTGDDTLDGGAGVDWLFGRGGNDLLRGGTETDALFGGDGDDSIEGGGGDDGLDGGAGRDTLDGGGGIDWLFGGPDGDVLRGGADLDALFGEDGPDLLQGGDGGDGLDGGHGDDTLEGGDGVDWLFGSFGNDVLHGASFAAPSADTDALFGQEGDDTLHGGGGGDNLDGGAGADVLHGGDGADWLFGQSQNDLLHGDAGSDVLFGGDGDDLLEGGTDGDALDGGDGADTLAGGHGVDVLFGGAGADEFVFRAADEGEDLIRDFVTGVDRIVLDAAAFGLGAAGALAGTGVWQTGEGLPSDFGTGGPVLYYETFYRALWFDADGGGSGDARALFALETGGLSEGDIWGA